MPAKEVLVLNRTNSVGQPFPWHHTKGARTFLTLKGSSQMGRGYTHIQRALSGLQVQRTLISAERSSRQQKASSVNGVFSKQSTLEADGAPPEIRSLSEDSED